MKRCREREREMLDTRRFTATIDLSTHGVDRQMFKGVTFGP